MAARRKHLFLAVLSGAAIFVAAGGGCSAQGNEIPAEVEARDAGRRDVLTNEDDPFDSSTASYDARTLFDSGPTATGDSGPVATTCGMKAGSQGGACNMATDLGSISGDSSPSVNSITFTGSTSQWLFVNVSEDSNSINEHDLSLKATLTGPGGSNYDLYLYVDPSGTPTTHSCQTESAQSTNAAGMTDEATITWDDNQITQPNNDTRLVSIKVEHVSGPCGAGNDWSLTVVGNVQ